MSDRDDLIARIRGASNPRPVPASIEHMGEVFLRVMTPFASEQTRQVLAKHAAKEDGLATGRMLATMLCDSTGGLIFDPDSDEHARMLSQLPNGVVQEIARKHREANGIVQTKEEAEGLGKA